MPSGKLPSVDSKVSDKHYRVRMRSPYQFTMCRTPYWASTIANSVVSNAKVVMCRSDKTSKWYVQSVIIPKVTGRKSSDAKRLGIRIRDNIEKR